MQITAGGGLLVYLVPWNADIKASPANLAPPFECAPGLRNVVGEKVQRSWRPCSRSGVTKPRATTPGNIQQLVLVLVFCGGGNRAMKQ
jgi:hypothetical protein